MIGSARVSVGDYFRARSGLNFNVTSGVLSIGDNVFFNRNCSINVRKNVSIGNDCMFGENVLIYDHDHNFKKLDIPFSKQGFFCDEVKIGNNVWIGSNTIILKGVSIGNNVVVGAGSVVSKNIESDCIYRQDIIRNIKFINRD
ncbi:acyltransferase [Vibrio cidicii]|uniref:acyltransferase n=1 Tax=Vibrio cidicii TaxID=1763883 RepID=UPI0014785414|nr:acyltransferase [Vibrio cidicii]